MAVNVNVTVNVNLIRIRRINRWAMVGLLCVLLSGCGYRFAGGGSFPAGIKSVFVEIFENRTSETGIEQTFTNDLIYEITRNGSVKFTSKDNADGVMSGIIVSSTVEAISRVGVTLAAERRIKITVDLNLTGSDGKAVWSAKGVSANESYVVDADKQQTETNKLEAIEKISEELSESVLNRLTSDF